MKISKATEEAMPKRSVGLDRMGPGEREEYLERSVTARFETTGHASAFVLVDKKEHVEAVRKALFQSMKLQVTFDPAWFSQLLGMNREISRAQAIDYVSRVFFKDDIVGVQAEDGPKVPGKPHAKTRR